MAKSPGKSLEIANFILTGVFEIIILTMISDSKIKTLMVCILAVLVLIFQFFIAKKVTGVKMGISWGSVIITTMIVTNGAQTIEQMRLTAATTFVVTLALTIFATFSKNENSLLEYGKLQLERDKLQLERDTLLEYGKLQLERDTLKLASQKTLGDNIVRIIRNTGFVVVLAMISLDRAIPGLFKPPSPGDSSKY